MVNKMRNFNALIKEANKEIARTTEFLQSKAHCMGRRNMKLYDIAWNNELQEKYGLSDEEYSDLFYFFCEHEYSFFEKWLNENRFDAMLQFIGRTSTFQIVPDKDVVQFDRYYDIDMCNTIYCYIEHYIGYVSSLNEVLADDGTISKTAIQRCLSSVGNEYFSPDLQESIGTLKEDLIFLAENLYKDMEYVMQDVEEIYNYLQGVQDNQISMFDDFLSMNAEIFA